MEGRREGKKKRERKEHFTGNIFAGMIWTRKASRAENVFRGGRISKGWFLSKLLDHWLMEPFKFFI